MRIALLAPLVSPIAEPFLGGAQSLLRDLAVGLAARGHSVTLYAARGSDAAALPGVRLLSLDVDPNQLRPAQFMQTDLAPDTLTDSGADAATERAFAHAFAMIAAHANEHDLLHAHAYDLPAFTLANRQPLPVVHTLHLPAVDHAIRATLGSLAPVAAAPFSRHPSPWLVTVSHACAATYANDCRMDAVIYNGITVDAIPFGAAPVAGRAQYVLYAGRITPEKGVEDALTIAAETNYTLLLAGAIYDQAYFTERVAPRLTQRAVYLGPVPRKRLWELMAGATATLCPAQWDEPFGLVACEAQAAGAPVIGYVRGGLVEVVESGKTGYLVAPGDRAAAVAAVSSVRTLDRAACRRHVADRFSLPRMLADYEAFYRRMLA
ncbi:MAG: glycosyltransferase [Ktedonobacterales bacterium]